MAYQDVKRAKTALSLPETDDAVRLARLLGQEHQQLAQEVVECHNRIKRWTPTITGVGLTSAAITLLAPARSATYYVAATFGANGGAWWVTARSTTGFTLNWVTALTNPTVTFLIVD